MLRNICLVDKQNTGTTHCPSQPMADCLAGSHVTLRSPISSHSMETRSPGTGNGVVGGAAAFVLGLIGVAIGGLALARSGRTTCGPGE